MWQPSQRQLAPRNTSNATRWRGLPTIKLFSLMTDSQFTKLIQRTALAYNKYKPLLDLAVEEYARRFGETPGDHDNDQWIDSLEGGSGLAIAMTAAEVEESALLHGAERVG